MGWAENAGEVAKLKGRVFESWLLQDKKNHLSEIFTEPVHLFKYLKSYIHT